MSDDPLVTARAWIALEVTRVAHDPTVSFFESCARALAAAVRAKGMADAALVNVADVVDEMEDPHVKLKIFDAIGIAAYRLAAHQADIPPPPRTP